MTSLKNSKKYIIYMIYIAIETRLLNLKNPFQLEHLHCLYIYIYIFDKLKGLVWKALNL